jgi:hypothetical protein
MSFGMISAAVLVLKASRYGFRRVSQRKLVLASQLAKPPSVDDEDELDELSEMADSGEIKTTATSKVSLDSPALTEMEMVEIEVKQREPGNALWPNRRKREPHPYFPSLFILFTAFSSLLLFTWASEKMPWLAMELVLPFILLTGWLFNFVWNGLDKYAASGSSQQVVLFGLTRRVFFWGIVVLSAIMMTSLYSVLQLSTSTTHPDGDTVWHSTQTNWLIGIGIGILLTIGCAGLFIFRSQPRQGPTALFIFAAVVFAMMSLFLMRTGFAFSYENGDTPLEMGMYSQVSSDVPHVMAQLNNFSMIMPEQNELPILYDKELEIPFNFYLHNYKQAKMVDDFKPETLNAAGLSPASSYPIIFAIDPKTDQLSTISKNYVAYPYTLRWFFDESLYRDFAKTSDIEKQQLLNQTAKATLKDNKNNVIISQGQQLTQQTLDAAQSALVLDKLYDANGYSTLLLNLKVDAKSFLNLNSDKNMQNLWRFVFFREQPGEFWGTYDFTVYVRKDLAGLWRQYGDLVPTNINPPRAGS